MRLSEDWPSAPVLPTMIVIAAIVASSGAHVFCAPIAAKSKKRRNAPIAAALVAVAMNAVIGVGAPS